MTSRTRNSSFFGALGAIIGGLLGYRQAMEIGMSPVQGVLILGAFGFIVGSAGGFLLRTLGSIAMYVILVAAVIYIFQEPIESMLGIDPVSSARTLIADISRMFGG